MIPKKRARPFPEALSGSRRGRNALLFLRNLRKRYRLGRRRFRRWLFWGSSRSDDDRI